MRMEIKILSPSQCAFPYGVTLLHNHLITRPLQELSPGETDWLLGGDPPVQYVDSM
jgi:hypothetical protein